MKNTPIGLHVFAYTVCAVVLATVGLGLYFSGSPVAERARRLDDQRTQRLSSLSYSLDTYYNQEKRLPTSLDELTNSQTYYTDKTNISDPETGVSFDYRSTDKTTYELCANFITDSNAQSQTPYSPQPYGVNPDFWHHAVGHTCFTGQVRGLDTNTPPKPL